MSELEENYSQACTSDRQEKNIDSHFEERIVRLFHEKTRNVYFTPTMRERFTRRLALERKERYDKIS